MYAGSHRETICGFRRVWRGLSRRVKGPERRRDPVIASPPRRRLIGRHRDFAGSLGWHDLKRDLRDFASCLPPGGNIGLQWFSIMRNAPPTKPRRERTRSLSFFGSTLFFFKDTCSRIGLSFEIFRRVLVALSLSRESTELFRGQRRRQNFTEVRNEISLQG